MARLSYIVTVIGIALMCVLAEEIQYYSDKYDDTDALSIMQNDKLREEYFMCFMEIGPCKTADAKFFKSRYTYKMSQWINVYDKLFDRIEINSSPIIYR